MKKKTPKRRICAAPGGCRSTATVMYACGKHCVWYCEAHAEIISRKDTVCPGCKKEY
jgi:hypothetical protein